MSSRSATDIDIQATAKTGAIAGLAVVFMGLVGMLVGLNDRMIIEELLSLGYVFLLAVGVAAGFLAAREVVLEGIEAPEKGARDVVSGVVAGVVGAGVVAIFMVMLNSWNLSDWLPKWGNPDKEISHLLDFLSFNMDLAPGIGFALVVGAVLGALGGSLHVLPTEGRRLTSIVVQVILSFAIMKQVVADFLGEIALKSVAKKIYGNDDGLEVVPAIVIAVVTLTLALLFKGKVKEFRTNYDKKSEPERRSFNKLALLATVAATIVLPIFLGKIVNELLANVGIFVLLALGLNIVVGRAGILDIGYVAFFAVGAYSMAVLTAPTAPWRENETFLYDIFGWFPVLPWLVALPVVIVIACIVGVLIGTPVIRMRGDYLAIVTLGFGEIIRLLFLSDWMSPYLGGAQGIKNIPGVELGFTEINGTNPRSVFYLVAVMVAIAIYISHQLETSRIGRAWMAIREDEPVAEAMGINTVTTKLFAFVTGAVLASFSGAVFAAKVGSTFPSSFLLLVSIIILVVVIVGGMGNIPGVIVGSVVLIGILGGPKQPGLLAEFAQYKLLIYGALLVFMMLQKPEGLLPNAARSRELHIDEALQDAWLKGDKPGSDAEEVAPA